MAALLRCVRLPLQRKLLSIGRNRSPPKPSVWKHTLPAFSATQAHHEEAHASSTKPLALALCATGLWSAISCANHMANPALCMEREVALCEEDRGPLVEPPEEVLDWATRVAGQSVPSGEYLAFVKEHFWKMPGIEGQQNVSGNYRVMCKRCGKGPVVWPTTRLKAHVIGEYELFTGCLLCKGLRFRV